MIMAGSKEAKAVEQFKKYIWEIPEDHDDEYLLTWLKARNYDVEKAVAMYKKSMEWRRMVKADSLIDEWDPPEVLRKYYAGGSPGVDKQGHPVWLDLASYGDFKGLLRSAKKSDIVLYEARQIEVARRMMKQQTEKLGRRIDKLIVIMDLAKLGLKHLAKDYIGTFNAIMEMTEANYPENLKTCYIINAPRIFPVVFNTAKPFLSEDTRKKIQVLGADWKEKLLEAIAADQLPVYWGGTQTDPDGDIHCKSKICLGGEVPEKYYMRSEARLDRDNFQEVVVPSGSSLPICQQVEKPGSVLRWEFVTEVYDIGFTVYLAHGEQEKSFDNMTELIPTSRVNSHLVPQDGRLVCEKTGKYWIVFDNTFSWMHSKNLSYCVWLEPPGCGVDELNNDLAKVSLENDTHL